MIPSMYQFIDTKTFVGFHGMFVFAVPALPCSSRSACAAQPRAGWLPGPSRPEHVSFKCTKTNSSDWHQFLSCYGIMKNQLLLESRPLSGAESYLWLYTFVFLRSQLSLTVHSRKSILLLENQAHKEPRKERKKQKGGKKSIFLSIHASQSVGQSVSQHIFIKCLCVRCLAMSLGHNKTNISALVELTFQVHTPLIGFSGLVSTPLGGNLGHPLWSLLPYFCSQFIDYFLSCPGSQLSGIISIVCFFALTGAKC